MTKNEIINEIKSVVMNNGGEVKHGQIRYFINENGDVMADHSTGRGKNINYESKAQLEVDLDAVKMLVEKYYYTEAETVETKVENTENVVEVEKNDNTVENMTKNEIVNKINKFMGNVDYFHYSKFVKGENKTKTPLNCAMISDDGNMYYRYFGDSDRIHFKKLKNCTKAELIAIDSVCKLYIDHMNSKLSKAA